MHFPSALDIADQLLEESRQALMEGRFDLYSDGIALPLCIETFEGQRQIRSRRDLRQFFDALRHLLMQLGVTDMVRRCVAAEFAAPDTLRTTHETRLLNGNTLIQDPYPVYSVARHVDGRWKVASSSYAVTDQPAIVKVLTGETDSPAGS